MVLYEKVETLMSDSKSSEILGLTHSYILKFQVKLTYVFENSQDLNSLTPTMFFSASESSNMLDLDETNFQNYVKCALYISYHQKLSFLVI